MLLSGYMARLWADAESAYRRKILEALAPNPSANLLDVGCEDGAWTEQVRLKLEIAPDRVQAVEIVPEYAEAARRRGFDVQTGDLDSRWPFEDASFDVVHANQVIEHVKRLDHFVGEIARVLAPRGLTIVCTENLASWHNVGALALGYQPFSLTNISNDRFIGNPFALHGDESPPGEATQHIHVITLTALRDILSTQRLSVEASWGTGYHPFAGRFAERLAAIDPRHAHFIAVVARRRGLESTR